EQPPAHTGAPEGSLSLHENTGGRRESPPPVTAPARALYLDDGPGLVDPGVRPRVFARRRRPAGRRRDVADRDRDDAIRIQDLERIVGRVHAEPGHRVLVALVIVGTDVEIPRRTRDRRAFELADDGVVVGPPARQLVRLLDGLLEQVKCRVR